MGAVASGGVVVLNDDVVRDFRIPPAGDWEAPADRKYVRPALSESVEELFHDVSTKGFMLRFGASPSAADELRSARLERAIGVIYRRETERHRHYFRARAADQFDAVIHVDETRAVEPLERTARWEQGKGPGNLPVHGVTYWKSRGTDASHVLVRSTSPSRERVREYR